MFGGLQIFTVAADTVWTPDVIFYDAVEIKYSSYSQQLITYDGTVVAHTATMTTTLTCQMRVKYFPFDTQVNNYSCFRRKEA